MDKSKLPNSAIVPRSAVDYSKMEHKAMLKSKVLHRPRRRHARVISLEPGQEADWPIVPHTPLESRLGLASQYPLSDFYPPYPS